MENIEQKQTEFNPYLSADKHYFAGYFNLASNNIESIFIEFKKRLHIDTKDKNPKTILKYYFTDSCSIVDWERGIRILTDYLPIMNFLNLSIEEERFKKSEHKRREYFRNNFIYLIGAINELRNFYTHYYHDEIKFDKLKIDSNYFNYSSALFSFLDHTLLKTALDTKKNYLKADKTKEILKESLKEQLTELFKLKKENHQSKSDENRIVRNKQKLAGEKQDDVYSIPDNENIMRSIYNDAFARLLYKDKNTKDTILNDFSKTAINTYNCPREFDYSLPISTSGIVFLLSMFLSKREIEDFKSNIRGFRGKVVKEDILKNNSLRYMATQRVYACLAFKDLKYRVKTTSFDKETLLMQMIDELSKVPDCVYQTLDQKKQEEFIEDINEYYKDNEENEENLENSHVVHPVIRKRYDDKFNYFALRYLDEFGGFTKLKFQLHLGNYIHHTKKKKIGNTEITSERIIKEKINVFGKLSEAVNLKRTFLDKEEYTNLGWELFPNPCYNFVGNNIPIYIKLDKTKDTPVHLEKEAIKKEIYTGDEKRKERSNGKPNKTQILDEIIDSNKDFVQGDPIAILSLNEIPALLYELLYKGTTATEIEAILIDRIIEQFNAIKTVDANTNLSKDKFPKKLNKATNTLSVDYNKLLRDIEVEINKTVEKQIIIQKNKKEVRNHQDALQKDKSKFRKNVFYTSEKGIEASWIANDLKQFMPQKVKENWKGYQHSELQRTLAFYEHTKEEIASLLAVWDFDNDIIGEKIKDCLNKTTFENFYEAYLNQRLDYFKEKNTQLEVYKNDSKILKILSKELYRFFKEQNYQIQPLSTQIKRLMAKPTCFPKGIFDSKPTRILGVNFKENKEQFADWFVYANADQHNFQSYYDSNLYQRNHSKAYTEQGIYSPTKNLAPIQQHSNFVKRQEGEIRKQKNRDLFTKLMVDDLFFKVFNQEIDTSLAEIFQSKPERLKNQIIADLQKDKQKGDASENIKNKNFIWNKDVPIQLENSNIVEYVKLKNVGKFRKDEGDQRIQTFIKYEPEIQWTAYLAHDWKSLSEIKPINNFKIQIEEYEYIRSEKLLKEIHLLEKKIYELVEDKNVLLYKGSPNFKKYLSSYLHLSKPLTCDEIDFFDNDFSDTTIYDKIHNYPIRIQKSFALIMIRNKFAHNQYPSKQLYDCFQTILKKEVNDTYANYFFKITKTIITDLSN